MMVGVWSSGTGSRTTMVHPPPGVSSRSSSPPTASANPRDTASPRPTPVPLSVSPRRWNGRNTRSRSADPDARSVVDDPEVDPSGHRAGLDPDGLARPVQERVVDEVGHDPLDQDRDRSRAGGRPPRRTPRTLRPRAPRLASALSTRSPTSVGPRSTSMAPVSRRLMSSRFSTRALSRSASSSMVWSRMPVSSGPKCELVGQQARRRRLDGGQRGAQVMAHGGQERGPQLVGPGQRVGLGRLGVEPVALQGGGQLGGEGGQDVPVLGGQPGSLQRRAPRVGQREGSASRPRGRRAGRTGRGHRRSRSPAGPPPGTWAAGWRPTPGGRPPPAPRAGRAAGSPRGTPGDRPPGPACGRPTGPGRPRPTRRAATVDQDAHHAGGHEEHDQGQHVAGVGDGEGVDGWREVVVGQQEPGDGGQDARPHARRWRPPPRRGPGRS